MYQQVISLLIIIYCNFCLLKDKELHKCDTENAIGHRCTNYCPHIIPKTSGIQIRKRIIA